MSVRWLVCLSVCHNFLKAGCRVNLHFHVPIGTLVSTCISQPMMSFRLMTIASVLKTIRIINIFHSCATFLLYFFQEIIKLDSSHIPNILNQFEKQQLLRELRGATGQFLMGWGRKRESCKISWPPRGLGSGAPRENFGK